MSFGAAPKPPLLLYLASIEVLRFRAALTLSAVASFLVSPSIFYSFPLNICSQDGNFLIVAKLFWIDSNVCLFEPHRLARAASTTSAFCRASGFNSMTHLLDVLLLAIAQVILLWSVCHSLSISDKKKTKILY